MLVLHNSRKNEVGLWKMGIGLAISDEMITKFLNEYSCLRGVWNSSIIA